MWNTHTRTVYLWKWLDSIHFFRTSCTFSIIIISFLRTMKSVSVTVPILSIFIASKVSFIPFFKEIWDIFFCFIPVLITYFFTIHSLFSKIQQFQHEILRFLFFDILSLTVRMKSFFQSKNCVFFIITTLRNFMLLQHLKMSRRA